MSTPQDDQDLQRCCCKENYVEAEEKNKRSKLKTTMQKWTDLSFGASQRMAEN